MPRPRSNAFVPVLVSQLEPGDILFKYSDGSVVSKAISYFTKSDFSHAAMAADPQTEVVEAIGEGISRKDLLTDNYHYQYEVFRCTNRVVAQAAANAADLVVTTNDARNRQAAKYSFGGLAKYKFRKTFGVSAGVRGPEAFETGLNALLGNGVKFFCSQFVVYCYHWVARQSGLDPRGVIDLGDRVASPQGLYEQVQASRYFARRGMMMRAIR